MSIRCRVFLVLIFLFGAVSAAPAAEPESAYARVQRTGVLRCGYQSYPPYLWKDEKTGAFRGVYPDIFEEIAKQAGLKIEWTEETGSDVIFTSLQSRRFDAFCSPVTATPARARVALFTTPLVYVPFYVYVRAQDARFDSSSAAARLDAPDVTFATKDGDLVDILAREHFPRARRAAAPGLTDAAQMYLDVATGKADAIVNEPVYAGIFMRNNPGRIKKAALSRPVQVFPATAAVAMGEHDLRAFFDTSLQALAEAGFIEAVLKKNIVNSDDLLPAQAPYKIK